LTCSCGKKASFRYVASKQLVTTVGVMEVGRRYYACRSCKATYRPWDVWAGVGERQLTEHARKMVTIVGTAFSFETAAARLGDLCQIKLSNDTVRRVCDEEGERARKWLNESSDPVDAIRWASGHHEFYSDGSSVNTTEGWREMRLSVVARREAGAPVKPGDWSDRVLPEPSAKLAICAIANCRRVGASWQRLSQRLGLNRCDDLSMIADGAKWIWDQARQRLSKQAEWCVDIFHVSQHLHECGKTLRGEGAAAQAWAQEHLDHLLEHAGVALIERLQRERDEQIEPAHRNAIERLLGYLNDNRDSLWYPDRLARGLPIGSGLIEGGCKNTIGARLKINSARWRVKRAERMGALRCLEYSGQTNAYWHSRAA
jgi:hypothetical protein